MARPTLIFFLLAAPLAMAQPTTAPTTPALRTPFVISVWQQPASSAAKWKARGVDTLYGYDSDGGRVSKADWEQQVFAAGERFIDEAGANPMAEAMQPGRLGFCQKDETDGSAHAGTPGNTLADLKAVFDKAHGVGAPVYANFAGNAFDNVAYDGRKHRTDINADRPFWHNAADGGYFAWADVIGFDYHLWTTGRAGMFDITKRLMDRSNDWSGGKPFFVYVETCTQGKPIPFTADNYEQQVWTIVNYAQQKGYKLAGIVYFTHQVYPTWKSYDMTAQDVVDRMVVVNAKLRQMFNPDPATQPVDPVAERVTKLEQRLDALTNTLTTRLTQAESAAAAANNTLQGIRGQIPATQPSK